jgi:protein TonB
MSAHASFTTGLNLSPVLTPVGELVDSIKEGAAALTNFDAKLVHHKSKSRAVPELRVSDAPTQAIYVVDAWVPATEASRLGKGGMLALVVAVHVLAVVGIASIRDEAKVVEPKALQVAIISAPQSEADVPPPSKNIPPPVLSLPVEPVVIDIALPDSNAITVAARPTEPPPAATAATGTPKTVTSVEYVREPQPKYPAAARALKQRGTVMLRVLVDSDGHAREVNLHRTSGHKILDEAARKAVLDAQFKPYMENGHALPVYVLIPIEFSAA